MTYSHVSINRKKEKTVINGLSFSFMGFRSEAKYQSLQRSESTFGRPAVRVVDPDRPFQCRLCTKSYKSKRILKVHLITHSDDRPFRCEFCDKRFKLRSVLGTHVKMIHEGIKRFRGRNVQCDRCPKTFFTVQALEDHEYTHTGVKKYTCHLCDSRYATKNSITLHIKRVHLGERTRARSVSERKGDDVTKCQCHICGASYFHRSSLGTHMRTVHMGATDKKVRKERKEKEDPTKIKIGEETRYQCHICGASFSHKSSLGHHIKYVHGVKPETSRRTDANYVPRPEGDRPFACDQCPKTYKLRKQLNVHLRTHLEDRPYACEFCDKRFKLNFVMTEHVRKVHYGNRRTMCAYCPRTFCSGQGHDYHEYTVHGIKKFVCDFCGSAHGTKSILAGHIARVHEDREKLQCHLCGSQYADSSSLSKHVRYIHGDAKPKCEICDKTFSCLEILKSHMNNHNQEKPYACEYCNKSFASNVVLKIHIRTHTGEAPYECSICAKTFKQRTNLTTHFRKHHIIVVTGTEECE